MSLISARDMWVALECFAAWWLQAFACVVPAKVRPAPRAMTDAVVNISRLIPTSNFIFEIPRGLLLLRISITPPRVGRSVPLQFFRIPRYPFGALGRLPLLWAAGDFFGPPVYSLPTRCSWGATSNEARLVAAGRSQCRSPVAAALRHDQRWRRGRGGCLRLRSAADRSK